jgi:hypothetical protein
MWPAEEIDAELRRPYGRALFNWGRKYRRLRKFESVLNRTVTCSAGDETAVVNLNELLVQRTCRGATYRGRADSD